jgi:hypothetical protein
MVDLKLAIRTVVALITSQFPQSRQNCQEYSRDQGRRIPNIIDFVREQRDRLEKNYACSRPKRQLNVNTIHGNRTYLGRHKRNDRFTFVLLTEIA